MKTNPRPWWQCALISFLGVGIVAAAVVLSVDVASHWYRDLALPAIMPPSWVFPTAWAFACACCATALALMLRRGSLGRALLTLLTANALLAAGWALVFFRLHALLYAFALILILVVSAVMLLHRAARAIPSGGWLFAPYAALLGYATVLNYALAMMNPT